MIDNFAPFDLQPAPDAEVTDLEAEWSGAHDESFEISADLMDRASQIETLRQAKSFGRPTEGKPEYDMDMVQIEKATDSEKVIKLTKTLAYLHSRGEQATARDHYRDGELTSRCRCPLRFQH